MGFEVVVRPAVLPNIRPAPAQSLPPLDDPDKGFAVIRGNGAKQIDLSSSWSSSTSMNQRQEVKRRVDKVRVYQENKDGTVNEDNFVDIEVANKMWMEGPPGQGTPGVGFGTPGAGGENEGATAKEMEIWWLGRVEEGKNIEVLERDKIKHINARGEDV